MKILKFNDFLSNDVINESNQLIMEEEKKEMRYIVDTQNGKFDFTEIYKLLEE
jgi:hypothetical protein